MRASNAHERRPQALLARAALFKTLARAFAYPEAGHGRALSKALAAPPPVARSLLARAAAHACRAADDEALRAEYGRLFLGSGPVRLHETAYGDGRRLAGRETELADLNGFYHAFGLALREADPDLPDHLAVELEFLSLLLVKEAYARAHRQAAPARIVIAARAAFLEQHLGRWMAALSAALEAAQAGSPYRELGALLEATVAEECRRERVRPRLATGRLPADPMQSETFTCPQAACA